MATATLIAHLAELECRNLHLAQGFRSLFGYCRHVLHCSEHEAYNRMHAVHAARRFPVILALLAEGLLHLTAVSAAGASPARRRPSGTSGRRDSQVQARDHCASRSLVPVAGCRRIRSQASSGARAGDGAAAAPGTGATAASAAEAVPLAGAAGDSAVEAPGTAANSGGEDALPMPTASRAAPRSGVAPLSADRYRLQVTLQRGGARRSAVPAGPDAPRDSGRRSRGHRGASAQAPAAGRREEGLLCDNPAQAGSRG